MKVLGSDKELAEAALIWADGSSEGLGQPLSRSIIPFFLPFILTSMSAALYGLGNLGGICTSERQPLASEQGLGLWRRRQHSDFSALSTLEARTGAAASHQIYQKNEELWWASTSNSGIPYHLSRSQLSQRNIQYSKAKQN